MADNFRQSEAHHKFCGNLLLREGNVPAMLASETEFKLDGSSMELVPPKFDMINFLMVISSPSSEAELFR